MQIFQNKKHLILLQFYHGIYTSNLEKSCTSYFLCHKTDSRKIPPINWQRLKLLASAPYNRLPYRFHAWKNVDLSLTTLFTTSFDRDLRQRQKSPTSWHKENGTSDVFQLQLTNSDQNSQFRMDVAIELMDVHLQLIRDWEDTFVFYTALAQLTIVSLNCSCMLCILMTPVSYALLSPL